MFLTIRGWFITGGMGGVPVSAGHEVPEDLLNTWSHGLNGVIEEVGGALAYVCSLRAKPQAPHPPPTAAHRARHNIREQSVDCFRLQSARTHSPPEPVIT